MLLKDQKKKFMMYNQPRSGKYTASSQMLYIAMARMKVGETIAVMSPKEVRLFRLEKAEPIGKLVVGDAIHPDAVFIDDIAKLRRKDDPEHVG